MSTFTHRLTIATELAAKPIAAEIARVIGPLPEEEKNFDSIRAGSDEQTPTHAVCDVIIRAELAGQVPYMLADASVLHAAVTAGYAARFPDLPVPTLADCQAFLDASLIRCEPRDDAEPLEAILGLNWGLMLIPPPLDLP